MFISMILRFVHDHTDRAADHLINRHITSDGREVPLLGVASDKCVLANYVANRRDGYTLMAVFEVKKEIPAQQPTETRGTQMKNIYEVLRQKELEIQQLQKEIEALRAVVPLLSDDNDTGAGGSRPAASSVTNPTLGPAAGIRQFP